jgi:hypothetical protein
VEQDDDDEIVFLRLAKTERGRPVVAFSLTINSNLEMFMWCRDE